MHSNVIFCFCTLFSLINCLKLEPISKFNDLNEPLILTPLLKAGKISEARKRSKVPIILSNIRSNSGFFTVNETYNSNSFFWFFKTFGDGWKSAPVLLWLHGGAGASTLYSVFMETGPFQFHHNKLKRRKYSWVNYYNVLFIDNPIGAGYSFTDNDKGYATTVTETSDQIYKALLQFFTLFPELSKNAFYISSESYGTRFAILVANAINRKKCHRGSINLKGLYLSSPFIYPEGLFHYIDRYHKMGFIDLQTKRKLEALDEEGTMLIRSRMMKESHDVWRTILNSFCNITGNLNHNEFMHKDYGTDNSYVEYLTSNSTRKALHVGLTDFNNTSTLVYNHFINDHFTSLKSYFEVLMNQYHILISSGQLDLILSPQAVENFVRSCNWSRADEMSKMQRQKLYIDKKLMGYYTKSENLIFFSMRNAGHMLSVSQPYYTLELLVKFINNEI